MKRKILIILTVLTLSALCGCALVPGNDLADVLEDLTDEIGDEAEDLADEAKDEAEDRADELEDALEDAREDVKDSLKDANEDVKDAIEDTAEETQDAAEDVQNDDTILQFTAEDLDHNKVSLRELASSNKVTMINFWATFCGPCIREMPDLGDLERKYKDSGFEIIGLTGDVVDQNGNCYEDVIDDARYIIQETGVTYPVLIADNDMMDYVELVAFPTTIFVDARGNLLTEPIVGSQDEAKWDKIIRTLLDKTE